MCKLKLENINWSDFFFSGENGGLMQPDIGFCQIYTENFVADPRYFPEIFISVSREKRHLQFLKISPYNF